MESASGAVVVALANVHWKILLKSLTPMLELSFDRRYGHGVKWAAPTVKVDGVALRRPCSSSQWPRTSAASGYAIKHQFSNSAKIVLVDQAKEHRSDFLKRSLTSGTQLSALDHQHVLAFGPHQV